MRRTPRAVVVITSSLLLLAILAIPLLNAGAEAPANDAFARTWERTDKPIADLAVNRTWIWGPTGLTGGIMEPYSDAPGGQRMVQYYDKARMEIPTDPDVGADSPWYVTTGLLPLEMMTGRLQLGDDQFEQHPPADINIAGDPTDTSAPSYAEMAGLMNAAAGPLDQTITSTVDADGQPGSDDRFATYGVTGARFVPETSHTIASVFWDFMDSSGTISVDGQLTEGPLFQDPFFGFGYPLTEAYWSTIELDGVPTDMLIQVFERRVATYTPENPEGWKVETGNVGRHYYEWRYTILEGVGDQPVPTPTASATSAAPTATATATETPGDTPTGTPSDSCISCQLEYGLGEIGTAGKEPLAEDAYSPLALPYLEVPEASNDTIDKVVIGSNGTAQLNFQDSISVISDWSPSDKVAYVVDYNDGSVHVTDIHDAHYGFAISHTFWGRGVFHVKVWAVDPEGDVRTPVVNIEIVVE